MKPGKTDKPAAKYAGHSDLMFNYHMREAKRVTSYLPEPTCYTSEETAKIHQLGHAVNNGFRGD